jgi:hypothetical protein
MYNKQIILYLYTVVMKKTVVVDLEYMRPSVGRRGSRSRSRSRSQSRSRSVKRGNHNVYEDEELNINALLKKHQDEYESDDNESETTISYDEDSDGNADDDVIDSSDSEIESDTSPPRMNEQRIHPSVKDSDYAVDSDEDLLQSVLDEPTFPLDINAILSAMNKTENNTIANMTMKKINARRHEILSSLNLTTEKMEEFERKLSMYRVIENPYDLKHNQMIRWIPLRSLETRPYVTLGGTLFRVRENQEEGVHVVTIRNVKRFVFNIKFELNVVFQRLSQEELLILRAVEYVENDDDDTLVTDH